MNPSEPSWFNAYVRLDNKHLTIVRTEYTYTNLFVEVGGIQRTIKSILYFLIGGMTYRRWVNSILGNLYLMKNRDPKKDDQNEGGQEEQESNKVVPLTDIPKKM